MPGIWNRSVTSTSSWDLSWVMGRTPASGTFTPYEHDAGLICFARWRPVAVRRGYAADVCQDRAWAQGASGPPAGKTKGGAHDHRSLGSAGLHSVYREGAADGVRLRRISGTHVPDSIPGAWIARTGGESEESAFRRGLSGAGRPASRLRPRTVGS